MSPADVLKLIKEKGVKFVDLRFTDTRGKEQHVTVSSPDMIDPHGNAKLRPFRTRYPPIFLLRVSGERRFQLFKTR